LRKVSIFDGIKQTGQVPVCFGHLSDQRKNLIGRHHADENAGGDKAGLKKQVDHKADGATEQQYAHDAVYVKAFHVITLEI